MISLALERSAWPAQAKSWLATTEDQALSRQGLLELRQGQLLKAEAQLIASAASHQEPQECAASLELLGGLRLRIGQHNAAERLLERATALIEDQQRPARALLLRKQQLALALGQLDSAAIDPAPHEPPEPLETLHNLQVNLLAGKREAVEQQVETWSTELNSPEGLELRGRALKALGRHDEAMACLGSLLEQGAGSAAAWSAVLELNHMAGRSNGLALATATRLHPRDAGIATHRVLIELTDRQPAQARRSAFRERLLYSVGQRCPNQWQSDSNLLATYDHTGRADLTPYLHHKLLDRLPQSPPLFANVVMQLASQASPHYGPQAEAHAATFSQSRYVPSSSRRSTTLRVGLIGPDFFYHPVGRFIQMLLNAGLGKEGELHLINTGQAVMPRLQELAGEHYGHLADLSVEQQLDQIRRLDLDVAVDLAGWTGNNNGQLFAAGLAPVQVNYLGYFASSGLTAMDVWLGDAALFPDPMQEWHRERIVRLDRPFLAWQPDPGLREAHVPVPSAPAGPPTFGCFNHVRKLSTATLKIWAQIVKAVPGARLALKSFTSDDPGVVALLEGRMRHCGLDPDAVIWLPTCPKPEDHLRQYGLIDIALDPFPNGGCTTTCEALWMGVPVITLCGSHYVSRMATAVLQGANLPEWIAHTPEDYLAIACKAADRLDAIRRGRTDLRVHLQNSPLGNAGDLAEQLWQCFKSLRAA